MSPVVLAVGEVALEPSFTRLALIALLGAALGGVALLLARLRRRQKDEDAPRRGPAPPPTPSLSVSVTRRSATAGSIARGSLAGSGALAVAATTSGKVGCPACRREFPAGVRYCPYDSRRLVPAAEILERSRVAGSVCPRCRRSYDGGTRYCAHDAEELMAAPLWEATRGRRQDAAPTGVLAKICPRCAGRYDLATSFCGKDGAELMTIN